MTPHNTSADSRPTRAWLQLLRVPNLLTVPGDPIAGFLLASSPGSVFTPAAWMALAASLLFYSAGLLLNDWADYKTDALERPQRPLPQGLISRKKALLVFFILLISALALSWSISRSAGQIGSALALLLCLYNLGLKQVPAIGPLAMGACRGLSLLLGAAAAGAPAFAGAAGFAATFLTLYIAIVTHMAARETRGGRITPNVIGDLLGVLFFLQAMFCLVAGLAAMNFIAAVVLVALWPVYRLLRQRFYVS